MQNHPAKPADHPAITHVIHQLWISLLKSFGSAFFKIEISKCADHLLKPMMLVVKSSPGCRRAFAAMDVLDPVTSFMGVFSSSMCWMICTIKLLISPKKKLSDPRPDAVVKHKQAVLLHIILISCHFKPLCSRSSGSFIAQEPLPV